MQFSSLVLVSVVLAQGLPPISASSATATTVQPMISTLATNTQTETIPAEPTESVTDTVATGSALRTTTLSSYPGPTMSASPAAQSSPASKSGASGVGGGLARLVANVGLIAFVL